MSDHTRKPAIHNAMWPGLVGKGPDSEPPIDLDTMLDLTAAAEVDGVRFDGVDLFLFDPHVDIDSTDDDSEAAGRSHSRAGLRRRLARRAGLAADRRRLGDGKRRGARALSHSGEEGVRDRQDAARSRHPALRRRAHRLGRESGRLGQGSGRQHRSASPRRSGRRATIAEDYGERLAAEGEICWGGMHSWKRMRRAAGDGRPAADARLSGRHGAHAAVHDGLQRAGGPPAAGGLRLVGPRDARSRDRRR